MSGCDDIDARPLLPRYLSRHRARAPLHEIKMPDALIRLLAENGLGHDPKTDSTGNCGPHAFVIGLADLARRNAALYRTHAYKVLMGKRQDRLQS